MKYDIVDSWDRKALIETVNERMAAGWAPLGGVATASDADGHVTFYQTMIHWGEAEPEDESELRPQQ